MKYVFALLTLSSIAHAEDFRFVYSFGKEKLEYRTDTKNKEEAFKRGSQYCFDYFVKKESKLTENKGLDIIDACVNPR